MAVQPVRILAFAGSARRESFNVRLATAAAAAARAAGAEVTLLDMREYAMPLFDQDLEAESGMPERAAAFKQQLVDHAGWLIACPEYNSAITPLLKNAIDWASRKTGDEPPLAAFRGKTCALLSASPGALGGLRGLGGVRSILSSIGVLVLPDQLAVPAAHEAFDVEGRLIDARRQQALEGVAGALVEVTRRLHG